MDEALLGIVAIAIGAIFVVLVGAVLFYANAIVKAEEGHALVVSKPGGNDVRFGSAVVLPVLHRAEAIDLRTKTIVIEHRGKDGISCRDGIRADVVLTAYVRVNRTADDVLKVAQLAGSTRAGDPAALRELFGVKLSEALKTAAAHHDFEQAHRSRDLLKDEVLSIVGTDLGGWVLDDVAIDHLEQTPIEQLDVNDVLDAEGIRRITERTSREAIRRSELELDAKRQQLTHQHELELLVIELERRKTDALLRFRESTGRDLTPDELRARLEDELRQMIERVLDERQARS